MQNINLFHHWDVWTQIPHTSGRFHIPFAFVGQLLSNLTEDYQYTMTFKAYQLSIVKRKKTLSTDEKIDIFTLWKTEDNKAMTLGFEDAVKHLQKLQEQLLSSFNLPNFKSFVKLTEKGLKEYESLLEKDEDWEGWKINELSKAFFFMKMAVENHLGFLVHTPHFLESCVFECGNEDMKEFLIENELFIQIQTCN